MEDRLSIRDGVILGRAPSYDFYRETDPSMKNVNTMLKRLEANGMNDVAELHILQMAQYLKKIQNHKCNADAKHLRQSDGKKDVESISCTVKNRAFQFSEAHKSEYISNR